MLLGRATLSGRVTQFSMEGKKEIRDTGAREFRGIGHRGNPMRRVKRAHRLLGESECGREKYYKLGGRKRDHVETRDQIKTLCLNKTISSERGAQGKIYPKVKREGYSSPRGRGGIK